MLNRTAESIRIKYRRMYIAAGNGIPNSKQLILSARITIGLFKAFHQCITVNLAEIA